MAVFEQQEVPGRVAAFPAGLAYTAYAAYRAVPPGNALARDQRPGVAAQALRTLASARGVALRGTYDTSGYRSDAHVLVWLAAPSADLLQDALASFGQTPLAATLEPFWTAIGVYRPSELSKAHVPAFFRGEAARRYLCVFPVAHTPEWYLLDGQQRKRMILEQGRLSRDFPDVRANAVSSFGLGDHEALQSYESDDLVRIVDLLRHLRTAESRGYTLSEHPAITGVRKPLAEILDALP